MLHESPGDKNGELGERGGEYITTQAKLTWDKLGPIKMYNQIMKQTNFQVSHRLEYGQDTKHEHMSIYG
jgi:hypothetical protein